MSSSTESFTADNLFGGAVLPVPSNGETLELLQNLIRGTVLGKVLRIIGAATADPGNTGEGTIAGEALGPKSKIGTYVLTCLAASALPGGVTNFSVVDPDGIRLADAVSDAPYTGPIEFEITTYGTDFAAGDLFTVAVEAGSREVKLADTANVDGTEDIYGVLAEDTDASLAAAACPVYLGGEFSEAALTFAPGDSADDFRDQARDLGILFRTNVAV